jgi:hypothetical protein
VSNNEGGGPAIEELRKIVFVSRFLFGNIIGHLAREIAREAQH